MESLEQGVEGVTKDRGRNRNPPAALQRVRFEEAAVQEGDRAVTPGQRAALVGGPVQRSEEQGPEEIAVQGAPGQQAAVHLLAQEAGASRQPSLGLDEVEEENAG